MENVGEHQRDGEPVEVVGGVDDVQQEALRGQHERVSAEAARRLLLLSRSHSRHAQGEENPCPAKSGDRLHRTSLGQELGVETTEKDEQHIGKDHTRRDGKAAPEAVLDAVLHQAEENRPQHDAEGEARAQSVQEYRSHRFPYCKDAPIARTGFTKGRHFPGREESRKCQVLFIRMTLGYDIPGCRGFRRFE